MDTEHRYPARAAPAGLDERLEPAARRGRGRLGTAYRTDGVLDHLAEASSCAARLAALACCLLPVSCCSGVCAAARAARPDVRPGRASACRPVRAHITTSLPTTRSATRIPGSPDKMARVAGTRCPRARSRLRSRPLHGPVAAPSRPGRRVPAGPAQGARRPVGAGPVP
ncbi:hypothetical protein KPATCC21470_4087 [Kitasatospora purpeofusca]